MFYFFNTSADLTGAALSADNESAVYNLFSQRYRVRKVTKGFGSMSSSVYYIMLTDGSQLKAHVAQKSSLWGGEQYYVSFIE